LAPISFFRSLTRISDCRASNENDDGIGADMLFSASRLNIAAAAPFSSKYLEIVSMDFAVTTGRPEKQRTACLILAVFESQQLSPAAKLADTASGGLLSSILRRGDIDGKIGQSLLLHTAGGLPCERILLIGCGDPKDFGERQFRQAVTASAKALQGTGVKDAVNYLTELDLKGRDSHWKVSQTVLLNDAAAYRFDRMKSKRNGAPQPMRKMTLAVATRSERAAAEEGVRISKEIAAGMKLAKDLGNLPGNVCTPAYLADSARRLGREFPELKIKVLNTEKLEKLGMGALLAVASGSEQPAKLIIAEYRNGPASEKPVVLVGKGVTFDSGGLSIKPSKSMDEMKYDMCGAASVLGTLRACAGIKLRGRVVGIIPATENLPDGRATKPGDIVKTHSGQTVEILNTDAEGRLILSDALSYAERFKPEAVIDIATLTGACVVALGQHPHGLFGNDQALMDTLLEAGKESWDRAWQMPLWEEYKDELKSNFADMANIGGPYGGAIIAASFLSRFTEKYRWAHLDIAGTAWRSGENKGANGRPVALLTQFLLNRAARR